MLLRPDPWAAGAVGFAYLTFVALVTPAYFESAMPLGMRTYWAYQVPLSQLIGWLPLVLLGFGGIAVRLTPEAGATRTTAFVCLTLAAACYAAYLLGGTNFSYHLLPFHASILVCLVAPLVARLPAALSTVAAWTLTPSEKRERRNSKIRAGVFELFL